MRTKDAKTPLKAMGEIYTIDGVEYIKNRNESELLFPPCGVLSVVSAPIKTTRTGKRLCECRLFYF